MNTEKDEAMDRVGETGEVHQRRAGDGLHEIRDALHPAYVTLRRRAGDPPPPGLPPRSTGMRCTICCAKQGEPHLPCCPESCDSGQPK